MESFFGEGIPYGDPCWYHNWNVPYYKESHHRLRKEVRKFMEENVAPFVHEWDENGKLPDDLLSKFAKAGLLAGVVGPPWPKKYANYPIAGGVTHEEFDAFHELIITDELARCGSAGLVYGVCAGLCIGLPPILHFGSDYLKDKVVSPCLNGTKVICLAITEPYAGSDVANLKATAVKTADGKHYIVNGEKKWITNGIFADYFTVAVRTGGEGMNGISLLLIEKTMEGVSTRKMNCSGAWSSGTTYVTLEDVKVPVENLIGEENNGFKAIMYNFNHERWWTVVQANRLARLCLEESIKYAHQRVTFGKKLIEHPVIREKIANMARQVEATHCWLEVVTSQFDTLPHDQQRVLLGGPIALLKAQATKTLEYCARESAQIFGGLAYTRGGKGGIIERVYREVKAFAIPAGSEEIMLDLGVRQALRYSKL